MLQWIRAAWQGWESWIGTGKLPAIFLAVLLYLLMGRKTRGAQRKLVYYGGAVALLVLCPVSAALLMRYQTAFYDYPFIWSVVPVTILIAFGVTMFLQGNWRKNGGVKGWGFNALLVIFCAVILYLSGGMGPGGVYAPVEAAAKERAGAVWEELQPYLQETQGTRICLWAPQEILEMARMQPAAADRTGMTENTATEEHTGWMPELLYGRNMWDAALNAYTYDVYPEEMRQLYLWMEAFAEEAQSEGQHESGTSAATEAVAGAETESMAGVAATEAVAGAETESMAGAETEAVTGAETEAVTGADGMDRAAEVRQKVESAFGMGANCVLLPKGVTELAPDAVEWADVTELTGYYLLKKRF